MVYYLLGINFITMVLYGLDKWFAIKHKQRIRERTLLLFLVLGGCYGGFLGMILFHHKTKKMKFQITSSILIIIWTVLLLIKGGIL